MIDQEGYLAQVKDFAVWRVCQEHKFYQKCQLTYVEWSLHVHIYNTCKSIQRVTLLSPSRKVFHSQESLYVIIIVQFIAVFRSNLRLFIFSQLSFKLPFLQFWDRVVLSGNTGAHILQIVNSRRLFHKSSVIQLYIRHVISIWSSCVDTSIVSAVSLHNVASFCKLCLMEGWLSESFVGI